MDLQNREHILERYRRMVEDQKETLAIWKEGRLRYLENNVDKTAEAIATHELQIARLEDLIRRIEAGEIG